MTHQDRWPLAHSVDCLNLPPLPVTPAATKPVVEPAEEKAMILWLFVSATYSMFLLESKAKPCGVVQLVQRLVPLLP